MADLYADRPHDRPKTTLSHELQRRPAKGSIEAVVSGLARKYVGMSLPSAIVQLRVDIADTFGIPSGSVKVLPNTGDGLDIRFRLGVYRINMSVSLENPEIPDGLFSSVMLFKQ